MPSAALAFRTVCGCFCSVFQAFMLKRARQKRALYIAMLTVTRRADGVMVGLLLTYLYWGSLLLRCGDVESNPGPNPAQSKDNMRQSRLASTRSTSGRVSLDRTDNPSGGSSSEAANQPTLSEIVGMLNSLGLKLDTRIGEVKEEIRILHEDYVAMKDELRGLREEVVALREENVDLQRRNDDLSRRVADLETKTDDLEGRSKRNNLIFYGLPRKENETPAECEGKVKGSVRPYKVKTVCHLISTPPVVDTSSPLSVSSLLPSVDPSSSQHRPSQNCTGFMMKKQTILILVAIALLSTQVMVGGDGGKPLRGRRAASRLLASRKERDCKGDEYQCQRDEECCVGLECRCTHASSCSSPSHIRCKPVTG